MSAGCYHALPATAYVFLEGADSGHRIGAVKRGVRGYWRTTIDQPDWSAEEARDEVRRLNALLKISPLLQECMLAGSMFGFDVPAADPASYDAAALARIEGDLQADPPAAGGGRGLAQSFAARALAI